MSALAQAIRDICTSGSIDPGRKLVEIQILCDAELAPPAPAKKTRKAKKEGADAA